MTGTPPGTSRPDHAPEPGSPPDPSPATVRVAPVTPPTPRTPRRDAPADAGAELADTVATAARSVPGVFDLHGGAFGEVASYLPGRRVTGVRLTPERCEVHVVVIWGTPVLDTARSVQLAVAAVVNTPVDVTVEDIVDASAASSSSPTSDASTTIKETS